MKLRFALAGIILIFAAGAMAETTNTLSDAEIRGRVLAKQLADAQPQTNSIQRGVLQIRDGSGTTTNIPISVETLVRAWDWEVHFVVKQHDTFTLSNVFTGSSLELKIMHMNAQSNLYVLAEERGGQVDPRISYIRTIPQKVLDKTQIAIPFANSDFWICDLGLEFFHWPEQKILPNPTPLTRGRSYTLLESTNPNPATNGYSRVLSWIDKETGGILEAEAYDINGEKLKVFEPKSFKKVDGQWQLQEMEIRNVQTGSRTRLEFDLNKP